MDAPAEVTGFFAPVHRALAEPILLGGAPRALAIANGTLAAGAARRDPQFVDVAKRHLKYPVWMRP